jgi:thiol-disulfide isomerase/thioredoxin/YHS domain-containing protein
MQATKNWILTTGIFLIALASPALADESLVAWQTDLQSATAQASASQRLVLVHFWAPWCKYCLRMDKDVFSNPEVAQAIQQNFVPVKINADNYQSVAKAFGVKSLPSEVVITPAGAVVTKLDGEMLAQLTPVAGNGPYVQQLHQVAASNPTASAAMIAQNGQQPGANGLPPAGGGSYRNPQGDVGYPTGPAGHQHAESMGGDPSQFQVAAQTTPVDGRYSTNDPYANGSRYPNADPYANQAGPTNSAVGPAQQPQTQQVINNPYLAQQPPVAGQTSGQYENPYAGSAGVPTQPGVDPRYAQQFPAQQFPAQQSQQSLSGQDYRQQSTAPGGQYAGGAQGQPGAMQPGGMPSAGMQPPAARPAQAGTVKYGLEGYCPVTLLTAAPMQWKPGNPAYGIEHRGIVYLFAGPRELEMFRAAPDSYAPVLSGMDPVAAIDQRQMIEGKREFGYVYLDPLTNRNHVYLFSSKDSSVRFHQNPERYATPILQAMHQSAPLTTRQ